MKTTRITKWVVVLLGLCLVAMGCSSNSHQSGAPGEPTTSPSSGSNTTSTVQSGQPKRGGTLRIGVNTAFSNLDPAQEPLGIGDIAQLFYDTLLQYDPANMAQQGLKADLATSWAATSNNTVFTFHLRQGVKFSDGTPMTSDDVKATFLRVQQAPDGIQSSDAPYLKGFTVATPDPMTVVFTAPRPTSTFLALLADSGMSIMEASQITAKPLSPEQTPIGTGPFKLVKAVQNQYLEAVRNPYYWDSPRPYLDGVTLVYFATDAAAESAYIAGSIDMTVGSLVSTTDWASLVKEVPGTVLWPQYELNPDYVFLNTSTKPFNDVRVRQAFNLVDNEAQIGERTYGSYYTPALYGAPIGSDTYPDLKSPYTLPSAELAALPQISGVTNSDIQQARQLLSEAGYPHGLTVEFDIPAGFTVAQTEAQVYASELAQIGVHANITALDPFGALIPRLQQGTYTMGYWTDLSMPEQTPCTWFAPFSSATVGTLNYSKYSNSQFDALYQTACTTSSEGDLISASQGMERLLYQQVPAIRWPEAVYVFGARPNVHGLTNQGYQGENGSLAGVWLS